MNVYWVTFSTDTHVLYDKFSTHLDLDYQIDEFEQQLSKQYNCVVNVLNYESVTDTYSSWLIEDSEGENNDYWH